MKSAGTGLSRVAFALARKGTPTLNLTVRVRNRPERPRPGHGHHHAGDGRLNGSLRPSWVEVSLGREGILTTAARCTHLDAGTYDLKELLLCPAELR